MKNQLVSKCFRGSVYFLLLGFLFYFSCSDEDEKIIQVVTGTISGTLNLPADATGKLWVVMIDNDTNGDNGAVCSNSDTCGTGTAISYTAENVPAGTYYLYAAVFVATDGSQGPQTGDYWGIYGGQFPSNPPTSPNINITSGSSSFDIDLTVR